MILLSHPTGNANVRNALLAFEEAGLLQMFSTALAFPDCIQAGGYRHFPIPWGRIRLQPSREAVRLAGARFGIAPGWASVDAIYHALDRKGANLVGRCPALTGVYTYEDGALATLKAARKRGVAGIYELPIAYGPWARERLLVSAKKRPDWAFTLEGLSDSSEKFDRKRSELEAADLVVCPSRFVRGSLPDRLIQNKHVFEIPYGAEAPSMVAESRSPPSGPLQVLFVGSMSQRKGLADVLEAFRCLSRNDVRLHVLGSALAPMDFYRKAYPNFTYHPPCARDSVLKLMRKCDVFILPSIVEGRALVQLEALAAGLPLIVTENAGGADLVVEGETGFLVEPEDPDGLIERICYCADNREILSKMRASALAMAERHSWKQYRMALLDAIQPFLKN